MKNKSSIAQKGIKIALVVALACVALYISSQKSYYALIVAYCGIYAIGISGLDVLFGYTGQISFGHAAFFAIGAYTSAILSVSHGVTPVVSIILGIILSVLAGFLISFPASRLVKHFLSLLTIAFGQIVYLILNSAKELTGGGTGIRSIPNIELGFVTIHSNLQYAISIWILVAVAFLIKRNIIKSRVGYAFLAIKESSTAANGLGINTRNYKMMAFAISAAYMGLAGGLYAHLVGFISPDTFNSTQSTLFMTMLLFGGICTFVGPILGSVVLIIVRECLQSFSNYQTLIYGIFLLGVLFYFPNGVVGVYKKVMDRVVGMRKGGLEKNG